MKDCFLYIALRHINTDAVPFFLDGAEFIYDKQGNHDDTYPVAAQPL